MFVNVANLLFERPLFSASISSITAFRGAYMSLINRIKNHKIGICSIAAIAAPNFFNCVSFLSTLNMEKNIPRATSTNVYHPKNFISPSYIVIKPSCVLRCGLFYTVITTCLRFIVTSFLPLCTRSAHNLIYGAPTTDGG